MGYITAAGITVGILAGAWAYVSGLIGICTFAGFLGWASYFAAGGGKEGTVKAVCSNMSGVLWGMMFVWISPLIPAQLAPVLVAVLAGIMCWQANISFLSFIPGTFIGNACFYANGNDWLNTAIGLLCGVALGLASDYAAKYMSKPRATSQPSEES
jgi:hypothetical protein